MHLPILEKLKDGQKFDFATLVDNIDQAKEFWDYWWSKADLEKISRPELIEDSDPILVPTENKQFADLHTRRFLFDHFLFQAGESGGLPLIPNMPREEFRSQVVKIVGANSTQLSGRPQLVFAGGGYGSGKSTILYELASRGQLPVRSCHIVGVDALKLFVPEFSEIRAVYDGRASWTVQKECKALGDRLFNTLVGAGRSFVWDSSMSEKEETLERVKRAKDAGYELTMVGVLTPVEVAARLAMGRAHERRRFPNIQALPKSHVGFRQALPEYVQHFDEIKVFANFPDGSDDTVLIATKSASQNELEFMDEDLYKRAIL